MTSWFLVKLLKHFEPLRQPLEPELRLLTVFAVETGYPGASADRETARETVAACRKVRTLMRVSLGLPDDRPTRSRGEELKTKTSKGKNRK
jgi:hypothetical protein